MNDCSTALPQPLLNDLPLRHEKLRAKLAPLGADALILNLNVGVIYAAGTLMSGWFYLGITGEPIFFYRRPVDLPALLPGFKTVAIRRPEEMAEHLTAMGYPLPRHLALEGSALPAAEWLQMERCFPAVTLINGTKDFRLVRAVKTEYEVDCMRDSCRRHTRAIETFPSLYESGMTDLDFSIEMERVLRKHGSLGIFRTFGGRMEIFMGSVLAGDNAAAPSAYDFALGGAGAHPTVPVGANATLLSAGMTVLADLSGNFNGYQSDCSRTYSIGEVPEHIHKAHQTSIDICEAVAHQGRAGTSCEALYKLALGMAEAAGFADHFMGYQQKARFIGHGVGLEINELPVIAIRSQEHLEINMTIALEPKFVFPGVGAVGVENTYLVTAKGMEKLTTSDETLVQLREGDNK